MDQIKRLAALARDKVLDMVHRIKVAVRGY